MKNLKTWDYIISKYPNAILDFEYSNGETLFYPSKEAYETRYSSTQEELYTCFPNKNGFTILTDF